MFTTARMQAVGFVVSGFGLSRRRGPATAWLVIALSSAAAGPAEAQQIEGRTVAAGTGAPVDFVDIELLDPAGRLVGSTTSDRDGRFRLGVGAPGVYSLRTDRLGYRAARVEVVVASDSSSTIVVELIAAPVRIDSVDVTAEGGAAIEHTSTYAGLYSRRADPRWAAAVGPNRVFVHSDLAGFGGMTVRRFILQNAPPGLGLRGLIYAGPLMSGQRLSRAESCRPFYLQRGGIQLPGFMIEMILDRPVDDFEGIELYAKDFAAPLDLRPPLPSDCGVVVVWPRRRPGER